MLKFYVRENSPDQPVDNSKTEFARISALAGISVPILPLRIIGIYFPLIEYALVFEKSSILFTAGDR